MNMAHESTSAAMGRGAGGRFARGNKGGPGNHFLRRIGELRRTVLNFAAQDDMEHAASVLRELAMGGDLAAIKLLFQYLLGQPTQTVEMDWPDAPKGPNVPETSRPPDGATKVGEGSQAQMVHEMTKVEQGRTAEQVVHQPRPVRWPFIGARAADRKQTVERPPLPKRRNGTPRRGHPIPNGLNGGMAGESARNGRTSAKITKPAQTLADKLFAGRRAQYIGSRAYSFAHADVRAEKGILLTSRRPPGERIRYIPAETKGRAPPRRRRYRCAYAA
jgi:hypothetical protein